MNTVLKIVQDLGDLYHVKPGLGGMAIYLLKTMVVVCIILEAKHRTYRRVIDYLRSNPDA